MIRVPRRPSLGRLVLAACTAALLHGVPAAAQVDVRVDAETGRDLSNYPPSPWFDFEHLKLELEFPDIGVPRFSAIETLTVTALGRPRESVRLDAGPGIDIASVTADGRTVRTRREPRQLWVDFDRPVKPGERVDLVVRYTCDFDKSRGYGLTWSKPNPEADSETARHVQIHSQGQAEENHRWVVCHDFPNEKMTTELLVTVEDGYEVCSNGRLVSKRSAPAWNGPPVVADGAPVARRPKTPYTTWHWLQGKPHASYLITLVVGKFALVDINPESTWKTTSPRPGLPMKVYTPFGTEGNIPGLYASTPAMIAFFEARFDEPYPWDKYDQLLCRDFRWGGMENTSATTLTIGASRGEPGSQDDLIAHELAHQWFGDLVTCRSWEHLWLNEGWASYCEALWDEQVANAAAAQTADAGTTVTDTGNISIAAAAPGVAPGTDAGRKAYQKKVVRFFSGMRAGNRASAPEYPAMASRYYKKPDDVIGKPDDVYGKGASVLHMLRAGLGDENFFRGVTLYLDRHKFTPVESDDFRKALEAASGRSLERFFDQWVKRPGVPRLEIDLEYAESGGSLAVTIEQTQKIDELNPAYEFSLPILLKFEDGTKKYVYADVRGRVTSAVFAVPSKPSQVSIDPNLTVLAGNTVRKELAWWLDELKDGESLFARAAAAEYLASVDAEPARAAIEIALRDDDLRPIVQRVLTTAQRSDRDP